ncbi:hypothetical protein PEC18_15975 [Paucibacter sp. O1-1]|nr:hypothetical protein [Paucibacter sp. O1-1]MDA3827311.1 hypothetical protein [Paucibacter sp. O1-1]
MIAVTAPSSGVPAPLHARLDLVIEHLRAQGYRVVEGHVCAPSTRMPARRRPSGRPS